MSELGLGTMSILKHGEQEAVAILDQAVSQGIRHIDTADVYDRFEVERIIGDTLASKRQHLFLASKGGNIRTDDGMTWDPSPPHLEQALHASLKRLKTDYLDLYYVHGGTMDDDLDATIDFMKRQKQAGTIRQIGLSSLRPNVIRYWLEHGELDRLMTPYSVLDRRVETIDVPVPIVGRGVLAKGLLTEEWPTRLTDRGFEGWSKDDLTSLLNDSPSPLQAYALAAARRVCDVVLPGASSVRQLNETIRAYETSIDEARLDRYLKDVAIHPYTNHTT